MKVNMSALFFIVSPDNRDSSFDPCCSVLALPLTKLLDPRNYLVHNINDRLWNNRIVLYWSSQGNQLNNRTWFDATLVKRFNDCNREVTIHRPNVSTLLSSVFIRGGNSSSGVEARNEGTREKCRNVGSMNCNFLITIIKSLNQNSIKPCLIIMFVSVKCYWREHFLTPIIREVNLSQELSWKYLPV